MLFSYVIYSNIFYFAITNYDYDIGNTFLFMYLYMIYKSLDVLYQMNKCYGLVKRVL
jgi:hypothetical protein